MKFIVLNPHFEDSQIALDLKNREVHCMVCSDVREVDLLLKIHSESIDLVIAHDDDGLQINSILKSSKVLKSIPIIISFSKWSYEQCSEHQAGDEPANAYLRIPIDKAEWINVIDSVLKTDFSNASSIPDKQNSFDEGEISSPPLEELHLSDLSSSGSDPNAHKAENEGIDLGNIFGSSDDAVLEVSQQQKHSEEPSEISLEGISSDQMNPDSLQSIPIANPVGEEGEQKIDFSDISSAIPFDLANSSETSPEENSSEEQNAPSFSLAEDPSDGVTSPTIEASAVSKTKKNEEESEVDDEALSQMPYLSSTRKKFSALNSHVPLHDALIPGGTANPPDSDTLKKYLSLREMDVATLSQQLQQSKDHISNLEAELRKEKADNSELSYLAQEQEARIKNFEKEKQIALESSQTENQELKFEMKKRMDKIRLLEIQVREASLEAEKIKDRVRNDIRKIRSREKELENRLEIMRKDSEALLASRENRIIELKRKLDLIEFNMDILQNQYEKEKQLTVSFKEKLEKAAQVVRMAEGMLHPTEQMDIGDILTQDLNKDDKTKVA